MEIKGIDVSSYQSKPDWAKVSNSEIKFAILRIHQKSGTDSSFEHNYKGCKSNGILVGGYKYSYALTPAQAIDEAESVISVLGGRGMDFPIFYDLEWSQQRNLGKQAIENIAVAFLTRIKKAGYKVGIYCNLDWYNNVLSDTLKKYDCWIARYPASDNGSVQERLRPSVGVGWQYSSRGKVSGISGNVDMDAFYKDYKEEVSAMDKAIEKVILIAKNEIGYLEKKNNSQLDSKTANAGSNNYTKYWRDIKPDYQGQPWCAAFVSWCMMKAFGLDTAKKLLKHWPYVYCPTMADLFTLNSNPKVGDIVIFYRNGTFTHTGIVIKVSGDRFWTVEGNTSGGSTIIANGGGVCQKSYYNSNLPGTKFCTPNYSLVKDTTPVSDSDTVKKQNTRAYIAQIKKDTKCYTKSNKNSPSKLFPKLKKGAVVEVMKYTETDGSGLKWYFVRIPYPNDDGFVFEFVPKGVFTRISEIHK
jgi:GH25 family lysozyme M1 (1,4-beta-N-acetylmuramidase)